MRQLIQGNMFVHTSLHSALFPGSIFVPHADSIHFQNVLRVSPGHANHLWTHGSREPFIAFVCGVLTCSHLDTSNMRASRENTIHSTRWQSHFVKKHVACCGTLLHPGVAGEHLERVTVLVIAVSAQGHELREDRVRARKQHLGLVELRHLQRKHGPLFLELATTYLKRFRSSLSAGRWFLQQPTQDVGVPPTCPSSMTRTLSEVRTVDRRCAMMSTVQSANASFRDFCTKLSVSESIEAVASSNIKIWKIKYQTLMGVARIGKLRFPHGLVFSATSDRNIRTTPVTTPIRSFRESTANPPLRLHSLSCDFFCLSGLIAGFAKLTLECLRRTRAIQSSCLSPDEKFSPFSNTVASRPISRQFT